MNLIKMLIRIPFVIWVAVGGGLAYMDYTTWQQDVYAPLKSELDMKEAELLTKRAEVKKAEDFTRQREQKLAELQELTLKLDSTKSKLPRSSSIPDLLKSLADLADRAGLSFVKFRPDAPKPSTTFLVETLVNVELIGTYVQIMSFLDAAANMTRIVATQELTLRPQTSNRPGTGKNVASLSASVKLITYHLEDSGMTSAAGRPPGK